MTVELTAAQLDAQADAALEQMEAHGWQAPASQDAGTDSGQAPSDSASTEAKPAEVVDIAALEEIASPRSSAEIVDPLQFNVQVPSDYKATRAALLTEKAEAFEKMMGGEMEAKEYAAIESRVLDILEDLSVQRIRAETLLEANAQTAAQAQQAAISALIVKTKDEVPYSADAKAQRQFDMALQQVGTDPDNSGKPFAHLVNEAHKVVLALRGVNAKPEAPSKPDAPTRKVPDVPVTLSGLPNAGASGERSVTQVLAGLSGPDFDKAFDSLPKDQQQKYLKQA